MELQQEGLVGERYELDDCSSNMVTVKEEAAVCGVLSKIPIRRPAISSRTQLRMI